MPRGPRSRARPLVAPAIAALVKGIDAAAFERHAIRVAASDHDNPTTLAHVAGGGARSCEGASDIDGEHLIEILIGEFVDMLDHQYPRIVD